MTELVCDYCKETIEGESIQRGSRVYCCEACAFEAGRSEDCGGRTDSATSPKIIERAEE